jgi:hypothetical protein
LGNCLFVLFVCEASDDTGVPCGIIPMLNEKILSYSVWDNMSPMDDSRRNLVTCIYFQLGGFFKIIWSNISNLLDYVTGHSEITCQDVSSSSQQFLQLGSIFIVNEILMSKKIIVTSKELGQGT